MVSPIEVFHSGNLYRTYIVEGEDSVIGYIRVDCFPDFALVHPRMYVVNKTSIKLYQEAFDKVKEDLGASLFYDHVYADTNNEKIVNIMARGDYTLVGKGIEGMLYEHRI